MTQIPEFRNYIAGEWIRSSSGATFENRNPANRNEVLGTFPKSTAKDVDQAVAAAREAFSRWRLMPAPRRGELLFRVGELLVKHKEEFAQQMTREMRAEAG